MIKTINVTVNILVVFTVWSAAVLLAMAVLHLLVTGGSAVYHLLAS